jgi:hypothetical protein
VRAGAPGGRRRGGRRRQEQEHRAALRRRIRPQGLRRAPARERRRRVSHQPSTVFAPPICWLAGGSPEKKSLANLAPPIFLLLQDAAEPGREDAHRRGQAQQPG